MTACRNVSYDDQDDGRMLKAARKKHYIMFPAPISFLNDELKSELGMNTKKEDEEDDTKFFPLKVPIDPADKDSKTYIMKIHKYDMGLPEEFLSWWMTVTEQVKADVYGGKYDMAMNLAQAMLHGRGLDAFVNERRTKMAKKKIRVAKNQKDLPEQQIHVYVIFELVIRAFDIHIGWRDVFERQHEYTRRDLFTGKINPEKFSQNCQK
jgi:hypothetical protein